MVPLTSLWLPILLSAVAVFVASSVIHMVFRYHRHDYAKAPSEDAILDVLRGLSRGDYFLPHGEGPEAMKDPAFRAKVERGPVALVRIISEKGQPSFQKALVLWFVYSLIVGVFAAYITGRAHGPGVEYLKIFRFSATTAFLGYALAMAQDSIWYGRPWTTTGRALLDGLIYALLTGGFFGWLWPTM
jgi:hypothetical protein